MASQQRFTFVNVSTPQDAQTKNNKRRIRSAAAASGWAQGSRLDRRWQPDEESERGTLQDLPRSDSQPSQRRIPLHSQSSPNLIEEPSSSGSSESDPRIGPLDSGPRPDSEVAKDEDQKAPIVPADEAQDVSKPPEPRTANVKRKRVARTSQKSSPVQQEKPPSPLNLGSGSKDVFNCYPVSSQNWVDVDRVLHHMLTVFAPRGWPSLGITNAEGLSWERFMTQHALSEPALFNVRLLFASGDPIRMKVMRPDVSLYLRDQAVRAINEALNDPQRAISDPLILAVGRIALHESMYGDRSAANLIHRPAQHRMIMLRGGMGSLEFPELVKRLMRWADRVMSMQSDTPRFLPDDDQSFSLGQSVEVLEQWVPQEGSSLRQKVVTYRSRVL